MGANVGVALRGRHTGDVRLCLHRRQFHLRDTVRNGVYTTFHDVRRYPATAACGGVSNRSTDDRAKSRTPSANVARSPPRGSAGRNGRPVPKERCSSLRIPWAGSHKLRWWMPACRQCKREAGGGQRRRHGYCLGGRASLRHVRHLPARVVYLHYEQHGTVHNKSPRSRCFGFRGAPVSIRWCSTARTYTGTIRSVAPQSTIYW